MCIFYHPLDEALEFQENLYQTNDEVAMHVNFKILYILLGEQIRGGFPEADKKFC